MNLCILCSFLNPLKTFLKRFVFKYTLRLTIPYIRQINENKLQYTHIKGNHYIKHFAFVTQTTRFNVKTVKSIVNISISYLPKIIK